MRRPAMDPWTRDQLVSQRNMMQGMAAARVPAAYPVPRIRLPRMLGGLKGALPPASPPTSFGYRAWDGLYPSPSAPLGVEFPTWTYGGPPVGSALVALFATRSGYVQETLTLPAGWTELASVADGLISWRLAVLPEYTGTEDLTFQYGGGTTVYPARFLGGWEFHDVVGGTWEYVGANYGTSGNVGPMVAPDPSWEVWQQPLLTGGVYSGWYTVPPTGQEYAGAFLGAMVNAAGSSGHCTEVSMTPTPWTGSYSYSTIGAYGPGTSYSMAFGWRP